ncbi:MAG: hypothetical protein K0S09_1857 [Sphingobacteriaceae bacterium]|jgi:hypothetical protein|nr:hypothetical protein [Sphingobacteriaceae bacterium]
MEPGSGGKLDELRFIRSLPRGHFTFPLMEK